MDTIYLKTLKNIKTNMLASKLLGGVRCSSRTHDNGLNVFAAAYVLYKFALASEMFAWSKEQFIEKVDASEEVKEFLEKYLLPDWNLIIANNDKFSKDELLSFLLYNNELLPASHLDGHAPQGVLNLAVSLLDIKEGDSVLDLCSGCGNFFTEAYSVAEGFNYTGVEADHPYNDITKIRASLLEENITLKLQDPLEYISKPKADAIFSNYSLSPRIDKIQAEKFAEKLGLPVEGMHRLSASWIFNTVIMNQLKEGGKAVVLMSNGRLLNHSDKTMRQLFVEKGYVETVISLPENLLEGTRIQANLVILSHGNNAVTLMDASGICTLNHAKACLTDENVSEILAKLSAADESVITKTTSELAENDYIIYPSRYIEHAPEIENGVELKSISKNIFRGAQVRSAEFEEMESLAPTETIYLTPANIQNGILTIESGQYLKEVPRKMERFIVKNNCIILSRGGRGGLKSAVVNLKEETKAIITGNLFAIELDETKVDPFYLQSFLASETGLALMDSLCVGSNVPILSLGNLESMLIPMMSLEKQRRIGSSYVSAMDETISLKRRLDKSLERMKRAYDRGGRLY